MSNGVGSPAGISGIFTNGADGPATNDTNNATTTPGGVVSAPVDLDGWEPGPKDGAAPQSDDENAPTNTTTFGRGTMEYAKGPPPPSMPILPAFPVAEKTEEPVHCEKANGLEVYHSITLRWKDGIALEWWKQEGSYEDQVKKALLSQFDDLIKGQPIERSDVCTPKPPTNFKSSITQSLVFKDSSTLMPSDMTTDVAFNSQEELLEFLSHVELASAIKLPGK